MSLLSDAKEVLEIANKAANHDLYIKLVKLTDEIVGLSEENHKLRSEVKALRQALESKATLTLEYPFYFAEGDPSPFCLRCWETDRRLIHLNGPHFYRQQFDGMQCPQCKTEYSSNRAPGSKTDTFLRKLGV